MLKEPTILCTQIEKKYYEVKFSIMRCVRLIVNR